MRSSVAAARVPPADSPPIVSASLPNSDLASFSQPERSRFAIVPRSRIRIFGGQSVLDARTCHSRTLHDALQHRVLIRRGTEHQASAMNMHVDILGEFWRAHSY